MQTLLAIASSLKNKALPKNLIAFGEVGLSGEVRPVLNGLERIKEALSMAFKWLLCLKLMFPNNLLKNRIYSRTKAFRSFKHLSSLIYKKKIS